MLLDSKYRLMGKGGWGIAINLSAEWIALESLPQEGTQLADGLWFVCKDQCLNGAEIHNLMLGLKMVSDNIIKYKPIRVPILIRVIEIDYNPTDYQPEGLVAASANWAAQAFHFPKPEIIGRYDKEHRKFIFSFESQADSQGEDAEQCQAGEPKPA